MADGGLTIELDPDLSARLKGAAEAAGESVQEYALQALRAAVEEDWTEDYARVAEYEVTGKSIPASEFVAEFRAALVARFAKK